MKRILIADDHEIVRRGLRQILANEFPKIQVGDAANARDTVEAVRAFKLGASAYVSKQSASDELLAALRKALTGGRYVTASLAEKLAARIAGDAPSAPHETLSNRELQVLRLIALGRAIKEIAAELALSEKTIGTYRARLAEKMNLSTNVELTRYALQHKLAD